MTGDTRRVLPRPRPRALLALVVAVGVVLRALQLFGGASLSSDETMLGLNVVHRSFGGLADRLDFNQAAPIGLLWLEKLATKLGGAWDLELRVVPFLAGVGALLVFPALARRVLENDAGVLLATLLFAVSDPLVYWTTTDKQYAVDVFFAVAIPWLGLRATEAPSRSGWAAFALVAAVAQFLSHPSAFAVAATTVGLALRERRHVAVRNLAGVAVAGAAAFAVAYRAERTGVHGIASSLKGTPGAFVGDSSGTVVQSILGAFRYIAGIPTILPHGSHDLGEAVEVLAIALVVVGVAALAVRSLGLAVLVAAPAPLVGLASAAGLYPLLARTLLFLFPSLALALVAGIASIADARVARSAVVAVAAAVVVVAVSGADAVKHVASPRTRQQIEPVLRYLARHERNGDGLYVYYKTQYGLAFYLECSCAPASVRAAERRGLWPVRRAQGGSAQWAPALVSLNPKRLLVGSEVPDARAFAHEVERLRGRRRVWVIVSDLGADTRRELLSALAEHAALRRSFVGGTDASAAGAYLFVF